MMKERTAMTSAADFVQFADYSFDLSLGGGGIGDNRILTRDIVTPVSGEGALLSWRVRCEGSSNVVYLVKINDRYVSTHTVPGDEWTIVQEAIHTDEIREGDNTVEFQMTWGSGVLSVSDVMLFYRREVTPRGTVADFAQLADVSFDIEAGPFPLRILHQYIEDAPKSGEGALLTWNVRREGIGRVTYDVRVNALPIRTHTITEKDWTLTQEAIHTDQIGEGINMIEFRMTEPTDPGGILSIGDVILFYRKEVVFLTQAADFIQLNDLAFSLEGINDNQILTRDIAVPASGEGALLTWNALRTDDVTYQVKVNNTLIGTYTGTEDFDIALQESMHTDLIHQGDNTVEFRVTDGPGRVLISDVMLWYRKDVGFAFS
jgi:hypothetical protein